AKIELGEETKIVKSIKLKPLSKNYSTNKIVSLTMKNLCKTYKDQRTTALNNVNLTFYQGELVFIVGKSGSGKTTLLKLLTGLEECTSGEILYKEIEFDKMSEIEKAKFRRNNFGLVSQQGNLHPFISVQENLFLKEIFSKKPDIESTMENNIALLDKYHIAHRKDAMPREISGGELQRASIAVSLTNNPSYLFFDEPTANLDSELASSIVATILKLHQSRRLTTLIATHDLSLIPNGSRVVELKDGEVERNGLK
ncbi:MAG: ATP-binding cassette domain-containing protein, partial [Candidatus Thorarchaeota archaeon]